MFWPFKKKRKFDDKFVKKQICDCLDYFLDKSNTTGNQSTIYFAGGSDLEVMESVEEIENLVYSIPKDMIRRTLEELKNASEYLKEGDLKL